MNVIYSWLIIALASLSCLPTAHAQCTLCADGSAGDVTLSFGSTSCDTINQVIGSTPADSPECLDLQVQTYRYCACPTYPSDQYCSLCTNGAFTIANPSQAIPALPRNSSSTSTASTTSSSSTTNSGDYYTCEEVLFARKDNGNVCDILPSAAHVCGCPDSTLPDCSLCTTAGGSVTASDKRVPPLFTTTCTTFQAMAYMTTTASECSNLLADVPVDVSLYCACNDTTASPEATCFVCGNYIPMDNLDTIVVDATLDLTCDMLLNDVAPFVNDNSYCTTLQSKYQGGCCQGAPTNPPSSQPTAAPTTPAPTRTPDAIPAPTSSGSDATSPATTTTTTTAGGGSSGSRVRTFGWEWSLFGMVVTSLIFMG
jgi:hypothetical protein